MHVGTKYSATEYNIHKIGVYRVPAQIFDNKIKDEYLYCIKSLIIELDKLFNIKV